MKNAYSTTAHNNATITPAISYRLLKPITSLNKPSKHPASIKIKKTLLRRNAAKNCGLFSANFCKDCISLSSDSLLPFLPTGRLIALTHPVAIDVKQTKTIIKPTNTHKRGCPGSPIPITPFNVLIKDRLYTYLTDFSITSAL